MDWWRAIKHRMRQRLHALSERGTHLSVRGWISGRRSRSSEQATESTDISNIFADMNTVPPWAASDAIEEGVLVLQFTSSTGATLTVTEIDDRYFLCCHEPPSSWLSGPSSEVEYYHLSGCSWSELADTLVPLLALGWDLEESTTTGTRQRQLTSDDQSSKNRS